MARSEKSVNLIKWRGEDEEHYQKRRLYQRWPSLNSYGNQFEELYERFKAHGTPTVECIEWMIAEAVIKTPDDKLGFVTPLLYYTQFYSWFFAPAIDGAGSRLFVGCIDGNSLWAEMTGGGQQRLFIYHDAHAAKEGKKNEFRGERQLVAWHDALRQLFGFAFDRQPNTPIAAQTDPTEAHDDKWRKCQNDYMRAVIHLTERFRGLKMRWVDSTTLESERIHDNESKFPFIDDWDKRQNPEKYGTTNRDAEPSTIGGNGEMSDEHNSETVNDTNPPIADHDHANPKTTNHDGTNFQTAVHDDANSQAANHDDTDSQPVNHDDANSQPANHDDIGSQPANYDGSRTYDWRHIDWSIFEAARNEDERRSRLESSRQRVEEYLSWIRAAKRRRDEKK